MTVEQAGYQSGIEDVTSDESSSPEPLSKDEIYHLLQNQRRRNVLRYLQDTEGSVRMRDVAEQVAAWEYNTTVNKLSSKERQRVYIALYQSHLPKLDRSGLIDYNQDRGVVTPRPMIADVFPYIDTQTSVSSTETNTDQYWAQYHLGVSFVSVLLLSGAALSLPPATFLSNYAVGVLIFAMFAASPLVQPVVDYISDRE
ncbi:DUF7344 domain-containing protein (plasmid) [Haloferacaceae archaeon DSL9]